MKKRQGRQLWIALVMWFCFGLAAHSQTASQNPGAAQKGTPVSNHARGTFEVKLTPQPAGEDASLGRMQIDKQFSGEIEGTSKGEMLTAGTSVKGSGAYVAIERVTGTLKGRRGSFTLQHSGTMTRGAAPQLTISVVPDSGTDQLTGLTGTMTINIVNGKHLYDFEYTLPEKP
jgi:Protein of unknown function (DUF3224)